MKQGEDNIDSSFIFELEYRDIALPAAGWRRHQVLHIVRCETAMCVQNRLWGAYFDRISFSRRMTSEKRTCR